MNFKVEYKYKDAERIDGVYPPETLLRAPKKISWRYEGVNYEFLWDEKFRSPQNILLLDQCLLLLYYEDHPYHPHPNNLILYNLKKEVIKVIENPTIKKVEEQRAKDIANAKPLTFWDKLFGNKPIEKQYYVCPFRTIWGIKEIEGSKYIRVNLDINYYNWFTYYLDAETFEFHPKFYDYNEDNGRYSKRIEYGRE